MHQYPLVVGIVIISLFTSCHQGSNKAKQTPATASGRKLSVTDIKADLVILWSAVKELHPGYGFYISADSIANSYNTLFSSVNDSMYEEVFIAKMYPFLCTLGCGHTQIKHSAGYKPAADIRSYHLPFEVLVHHDRAWVTTQRTTKLATGDEIISINDTPASVIIKNGYSLYCGDGHVESFKELYLSEYDGFEDVCNIHYKWAPPYRVSVRTNKGILKTEVLDSYDAAPAGNTTRVDKYANWTRAKDKDDLALYFSKQDNTALFEVKRLEYEDTVAYKEFFDQIAQQRSKNLILDMRHNGGGDLRIVIRLLSYLADSSFAIIKDVRSRVPDPSINSETAYFDPQRTESFKGSCLPGKKENNWWHMDIRPEFAKPYGPNAVAPSGRFDGNLFVLIDGATFSSAALFTVALKAQRKNVIFIGRETAGTEEGCNGFTIQRLTLPNSGIVVEFPWLRVVSMARSPLGGRGFLPDYPVDYTPEDVVNGNDPDLTKALEVIRKKR